MSVAVAEPRIAPPRSVATRALWSRLLLIGVHVAGAASLAVPMLIPGTRGGEGAAHAHDAPVLLALIVPALLAVAVGEVMSHRMDAKTIALLGVLGALNAALRIPGGLGGASLVFFLPIACAAVFGATFGFLLGSLSFAVSAIVTAGVGPWLPFQMLAAGWCAAGGALLSPLIAGKPGVKRISIAMVALAAYGYLAGFVFGALTDLWFWPYVANGDGTLAWRPGLGIAGGFTHFWRFYVTTSLPWDAGRAIANAALLIALGPGAIRLLQRTHRRMSPATSAARA